MMRLVPSAEELPTGSHAIGLYGSRTEAARTMGSFLRGARSRGQRAMVLTSNDAMLTLYRGEVRKQAPGLLDSVRRIDGPHARPTPVGLRPIPEVLEFARAHPEGATMSGDTIPTFLDRRSLANILAYEDWFDSLRPFPHRGLCPYDLTKIPVDRAHEALERLARAHSHGVLSTDPNPGVRFLQLLLLPHVENPPAEHLGWLARAVDLGLMERDRSEESVELTPRGANFARGLLGLPAFASAAADSSRSRRRALHGRADRPALSRFTPEE